MSDHLIGELTNESTKIDGTITGKDQSVFGSLNPSAQTVEANITDKGQKVTGSLVGDTTGISGTISPLAKNLAGNVQNIQAGTKNYEYLVNKPRIEGVELKGDKTFEDLNLHPLSNADLARILD